MRPNCVTSKVVLSFILVLACGFQPWLVHCKTVASEEVSPLHPQLRKLLVSIKPDIDPRTVTFDNNLLAEGPDLPADDSRIKKRKQGCTYPEQVHLTYWSSNSVLVSWATCDSVVGNYVTALPARKAISIVKYGTARNLLQNTATGVPTSYIYDYTGTSLPSYASPLLHHVVLKGLKAGQRYFYQVFGTPDKPGMGTSIASRLFNFTMPKKSTYPLKIGVVGDPGQTYNSSDVLQGLILSKPDLLMLEGDFSYADQWSGPDTRSGDSESMDMTYQPKWDTFGRLYEPLLSRVPFMHCDGNHEKEKLPNGETHKAYNYRYPKPRRPNSPLEFAAVSETRPWHNLFYAVELPGVYKAIFLTTYSPNQLFSEQEEQYQWLKRELEETDRNKTPWLLVSSHETWYNTYESHYKSHECFRQIYEPLLLKHQVDVYIHGHVHAYERTKPVADYQVDECGPVHLTVGDGGNIEGVCVIFIDTMRPRPDYCLKNPVCPPPDPSDPRPCCISLQDGKYCPDKQPEWSAYRESSWGYGMLELVNSTHATWKWNKAQWPAWKVADEVMIIRGGQKRCGQKKLFQRGGG